MGFPTYQDGLQAHTVLYLQDNEGNSAVHLASTEGFDRVIETLLEYKANPDLPNIFGKTAAHYLAMKNHVKGINVSTQLHLRLFVFMKCKGILRIV